MTASNDDSFNSSSRNAGGGGDGGDHDDSEVSDTFSETGGGINDLNIKDIGLVNDFNNLNRDMSRELLDRGMSFRERIKRERRGSMSSNYGPSDNITLNDDDMDDEWNRLDMAQNQLHEELATFMNMVVTIQSEDEVANESHDDSFSAFSDHEDTTEHEEKSGDEFKIDGEILSIQQHRKVSLDISSKQSSGRFKRGDDGSFTTATSTPQNKDASFATGFFQLLKPKGDKRLEAKKEELQREWNLKMTEYSKKSKQRRIAYLKKKKCRSLDEEKQRQTEILQLNLSLMDPGLEEVMIAQKETQNAIIKKKQKEMDEMKKMMDEMNQSLAADSKAFHSG